jgi:GNAT superfamily N-acetyltransferase
VTITVARLRDATKEFTALVTKAESELRGHRGGPTLLRDLRLAVSVSDTVDLTSILLEVVDTYGVMVDGSIHGFVAVSVPEPVTLFGVYVDHEFRRQGLARVALQTLLERAHPPSDAWALPGDRGSKSLYESVGWKARRLTMSAE